MKHVPKSLQELINKHSCLGPLIDDITKHFTEIDSFSQCIIEDADSSLLKRGIIEFNYDSGYDYDSRFYLLNDNKLINPSGGSVASAILQSGFSQENLPEYVVLWHTCHNRHDKWRQHDIILYKVKDMEKELLRLYYDKDGHDFITRAKAHRDGQLHGTVHIEIVKSGDYSLDPLILVHQRAADKDTYPNCWDIFGGHVDDSFDLEKYNRMTVNREIVNAALRELKEELGIIPREEALAYIGCERTNETMTLAGKIIKNYEINEIFAYLINVDWTNGELVKPDKKEIQKVELMHLSQLYEMRKKHPELIAGALNKMLDRRQRAMAIFRPYYQIPDRDPELANYSGKGIHGLRLK